MDRNLAGLRHTLMRDKLLSLGIGCETLKVFGTIHCYVHVTCVSRNTADKWAQLFNIIFKGSKVSLTPTVWEAAKNVGGNLTPTMRKGFLIAVTVQPQGGEKK
jgi:hypothetical protein